MIFLKLYSVAWSWKLGGITCSSSLLQTLATDDTMSLVPGHCVKRSFMVIPIRSIIVLITYKLTCIGTFLSDPSPIIGYACHSLTNSLTHSCLVNLIDVPLAVKMPTQNLLRLLLLLTLMMRIVLATVCCRFGRKGLVVKLKFYSDFEHKVWSRFCSWSSGKILKLIFVQLLLLMFCRGCEIKSWSRFWA